MHPVAREYVGREEALKSLIPPMPDLYVRSAEGVYTFQPLTGNGRRFLEERDGFYQADELRVNSSTVFPLFDAIFDAGLRVV